MTAKVTWKTIATIDDNDRKCLNGHAWSGGNGPEDGWGAYHGAVVEMRKCTWCGHVESRERRSRISDPDRILTLS